MGDATTGHRIRRYGMRDTEYGISLNTACVCVYGMHAYKFFFEDCYE